MSITKTLSDQEFEALLKRQEKGEQARSLYQEAGMSESAYYTRKLRLYNKNAQPETRRKPPVAKPKKAAGNHTKPALKTESKREQSLRDQLDDTKNKYRSACADRDAYRASYQKLRDMFLDRALTELEARKQATTKTP